MKVLALYDTSFAVYDESKEEQSGTGEEQQKA